MIGTAIIYLLYGIVYIISYPLTLFGNVSLPSWISSAITSANGYLATGYQWLPTTVSTILLTWGVYLVIEIGIFAYKGIRWVYRKFPGIN